MPLSKVSIENRQKTRGIQWGAAEEPWALQLLVKVVQGCKQTYMIGPLCGKRAQTDLLDDIQSRNDLVQEKVRWQVAPDVGGHEVF